MGNIKLAHTEETCKICLKEQKGASKTTQFDLKSWQAFLSVLLVLYLIRTTYELYVLRMELHLLKSAVQQLETSEKVHLKKMPAENFALDQVS